MDYYVKEEKFKNPIISGFYPDPSICRVNDDYYLVNSSFEYFPAIPVWHSKDLVHWEQICNAIDRKEQNLNLDQVKPSEGIQACTIRYYQGTFYIVSTRLNGVWPHYNNHFIITAKDPKGPWSECHFIEGATGIDSSLFFDDDGKAYFQANREKPNGNGGGDTEIWIQEIDLRNFKLIGEAKSLWAGYGGHFPEGPHIYKRNGYYYLIIAEGGTCHYHTVTLARSKNIFGPYEASPRNPLLTHKHLHRTYPIQNVGHADIVETQNGEWYMVVLGSRPRGGFYNGGNTIYTYGGYYRNLGRETFLVPMVWEDDYGPIVAPLTGRVEDSYPVPNLPRHLFKTKPSLIQFDSPRLDLRFCTVKRADSDFYSLQARPGFLRIFMGKNKITDFEPTSIIGIRQTSWRFSASTKILVKLNSLESTGLALYQNYQTHLRIFLVANEDELSLKVVKCVFGDETILAELDITNYKESIYQEGVNLFLEGDDQNLTFYYGFNSQEANFITKVEGHFLSTDLAGGHTGCFLMLYASANGNSSTNYADFKYLEFTNLE